MTTIPHIRNYRLVGSKLVLRSKSRIFHHLLVVLLLLGLAVKPAPAFAPSPTLDRSFQAYDPIGWALPSGTLSSSPSPAESPSPGAPDSEELLITRLGSYIQAINKDLPSAEASRFASHLVEAAEEFNLDLPTFVALVKVESRFDPDDRSPMGAVGLTQVVPRWHKARISGARSLLSRYSLHDPQLNLYLGAAVLKDYILSTRTLGAALARYNGSSSAQYANKVLREAALVRTRLAN